LFPRYDIRRKYHQIKISCHDLKHTGIIVYETGRRTILAGIIALSAIAAYSGHPGTPAPAIPAKEQNRIENHDAVPTREKTETPHPARHSNPRGYSKQVKAAGSKHDIDPRLIHAVIEVESRGNPHAVSPKGAKGLMQITPGICRRYGG
jgi:soluble lytic murein transglycosylase-like protein